jgi:hypothetical protein
MGMCWWWVGAMGRRARRDGSLAALRTGAGLVTAAVPKSILDLVARIAPELMMAPLKEGAGDGRRRLLENLAADGLDALMGRRRSAWLRLGRACRRGRGERSLRGSWWRSEAADGDRRGCAERV